MLNIQESKIYKLDTSIDDSKSSIIDELNKAIIDGNSYFVISDTTNRTNGFNRGSLISRFVSQLKVLTANTTIPIVIKNAYEDLDFYTRILDKVPGVFFYFDKNYAEKYSNNTIEEWELVRIKYSIN